MKKVYGLLVALIFGAAFMVKAAPLEKNNIRNNVVVSNHTEAADGTQQMHHRRVIHHRRRVIHHRRRHRSPHATVIIHH